MEVRLPPFADLVEVTQVPALAAHVQAAALASPVGLYPGEGDHLTPPDKRALAVLAEGVEVGQEKEEALVGAARPDWEVGIRDAEHETFQVCHQVGTLKNSVSSRVPPSSNQPFPDEQASPAGPPGSVNGGERAGPITAKSTPP